LDVLLSVGKSMDCSEPDQAEFQQRLTVNLIKALGLNAWDYPKGFGLIRSLVALLLLQKLYHVDWIKRYDQVCIALREAGVSPDRMSLLRQWKFRMREGSAAAHLKRLIKGASDLPLDSRPRIREELDALKARHTGYFF